MDRSIGFCFTNTDNEGVPIEQRRGIELLDLNDYLILIQAPIEQVGQALCQTRQVTSWQRNVYEQEIELVDQESTLIFQFRKHHWTIIGLNWFFPNTMYLDDEAVQLLSAWMHTKAIIYLVSDGGGSTGYHFYNCGEFLERFSYDEDEPTEETNADEDETESMRVYKFCSQLRRKEAHEIGDLYTFINEFLQEQDAYAPACKLEMSLKVGQKVTLKMKGIERDDLERMDYITLSA